MLENILSFSSCLVYFNMHRLGNKWTLIFAELKKIVLFYLSYLRGGKVIRLEMGIFYY